MYFTQRAQRINKDVVGGSEIWVLMKQTMPQDLSACDDLIGEKIDRARVTSFQPGEALVFESGQHFFVRFDERQSKHLNRTPTLEDAIAHYQHTNVPGKFTTLLEDEDDYPGQNDDDDISFEEDEQHEPQPTHAPVANAKKQEAAQEAALLERGINAYLEGATTQPKLAAKLGITAWEARQLMPKIEAAIAQLEATEQS